MYYYLSKSGIQLNTNVCCCHHNMRPDYLLFCTVERLERIPWIAPECVDSGAPVGNAADQWSFGVTLLEICNNGDLPMGGATLSEVIPALTRAPLPAQLDIPVLSF